LRAQEKKEKETQKTPRRRIIRSATEDRQGREVAVERVVPTRPSRRPPKANRNARRFGAERQGGGGAGTGRAPRPRR
jgi:hypothetical protein